MLLYELEHIIHHYNGRAALSIERWQMPADTIVGLAGPNGSGKSTLLGLLGFIRRPTSGEIRFQGRSAEPFSDHVRHKVALVPQDAFMLKRTVYANIAYGMRLRPEPPADEQQRIYEALNWVGLAPEAFAQRPWYALSGGEARRVALAARLVLRPQVLLLDEPTASVDAASARLIKDAVLNARSRWGTSLVVASHDTEWLQEICDDVVNLFRGKMLGSGQQTLLFGPWRTQKGLAEQTLSGKHVFVAAPMPEDAVDPVAALNPDQVTLYAEPAPIPAAHHLLKGTVLRLGLERSSGRIIVSVIIGTTVFTAHLSTASAQTIRLMPGQSVWVAYDPGTVQWF